MGRNSNRITNYGSAKGKMLEMSKQDVYYKIEDLRTVLRDISNNHKKWGTEWYELVALSMFDDAKTLLLMNCKGEMVVTTIYLINELADLKSHLAQMERGE